MPKLPEEKKEKMTYDARFAGPIGEHYRLLKESVPHHEEFQDSVMVALREFTAMHPDKTEFKAVEAGCGIGYTTDRILRADPRIMVTAVDNEPTTISQAKEALADMGERITFDEKGILEALQSLEDESVDIFASAYTIHNFDPADREKVLKEVARVLKKGGFFVNADKYAMDDEAAHLKSLEEQLKNLEVYDQMGMPEIREGWAKHYAEDEERKFTEKEQKELLEKYGFEEIQTVFRQRMEATIQAVKPQ